MINELKDCPLKNNLQIVDSIQDINRNYEVGGHSQPMKVLMSLTKDTHLPFNYALVPFGKWNLCNFGEDQVCFVGAEL